jgi:ribosomal protein S4
MRGGWGWIYWKLWAELIQSEWIQVMPGNNQYVRIARRAKGSTSQVLLQLLEMRSNNIIFQLGMAPTIPGARQLVNHGHIWVNDHMVDIPSYLCKSITIRDQQRLRAKKMDHPFQSSLWLSDHVK